MQQQSPQIITKASGKVLIAGGYGVLQQHNYGLTLALNSNFYCICTSYIPNETCTDITVSSFQINQSWHYINNNNDNSLKQTDGKNNIFVENAILWTLRYFNKQQSAGNINLQILFDRNFISDKDALNQEEFTIYKSGYNKTGLGSSACVLVSIVKCVTRLLSQKQQNRNKQNRIINLISQIANLSAQKKIGSNFDISTAVYGTHLYQNILPHRLSPILHNYKPQTFHQLLQIDPQICPLTYLPIKLYSYIIDINKGADTRVMVGSFMSQLRKCSKQIQSQFFNKSKQITLKLYSSLISGKIIDCKQINNSHRILQRKYSQITGVQIQPKDLTTLIDNICLIDGVIYGICPGSGGYDAVFVLSEKDIDKQLKEKVGNEGEVRNVQINFRQCSQVQKQQRQKIIKTLQKYNLIKIQSKQN